MNRWTLALALLLGWSGLQAAEIQTFTLDNGLHVYLVKNRIVPLVTIVTSFHAGGTYEDSVTNGLFHLYEHMLFKGNAKYPDQLAFKKRLRELGIIYNGSTSTEQVEYHYTLPSRLLREGLDFMAAAMISPRFDEEELHREIQVVMDEFRRDFSQPTYQLYQETRRAFYGPWFYRKNVIGDSAQIKHATRDLMLQIQRNYYNPNNCNLIVAGDLDFATARRYIEEAFGGWKNQAPPPQVDPVPHVQESRTVELRLPAEHAYVYVLYAGPNVGQQTEDTYVADLLGTLLNAPGSRFQTVFVDSGLATSASFGYYTQRYGGELSFYFVTEPEKVPRLRRRLARFVQEMAQPEFYTEEALENAKRAVEIDYLKDQEVPSRYAVGLAFWITVTGYDYYRTYVEQIREVPLDAFPDFVRRYLVDQPHATGILYPTEEK